MPDKSNNPFQFWEELKRRRVVRVITVYAAAAFVILELVDIITEPFGLPDWTLKLVFILLCIGLIISVILSWVYDITPEGIEKTKPSTQVKPTEVQPVSKGWRAATFVSVLIIIAFVVFYIVGNNKKSFDISKLEKSIAVLPLDYLSEDPSKQYLANGVLDAITGHLSLIEGLRVMPRTSVEQYRENKKSAKEIGEELDVSYLIEGSFLMIEDQVKLTIQLVVAEEGDHVFFKEYDRDYKDIIVVQSEVAQTIAKEIEVAITPQEKQRIEKPPTTSLTAYDYYQRGREEYWRSRLNREYGTAALKQAEYFFNKALEYDPRYALAYAGLAMVYYSKYFTTTRSGEQYSADYYLSVNLDSMNLLAQRAMDLDDQIADAYFAKGVYEQERGNLREGLEYMNDGLIINPNHIMALIGAASIYGDLYDFVNGLDMLHKAASMERGSLLPVIYLQLYDGYSAMDFPEKSLHYLDEYLSLTGDSITFFINRYAEEVQAGNQEKANKYAAAAWEIDSTNPDAILYMGRSNLDSKRYEEAYKYIPYISNCWRPPGIWM